ncbi:MAG: hypothetical protein U1C12_00965 [Patescibacteria group bacterium]|nr:hypothetical protein [Patescibacteria group bacterium]
MQINIKHKITIVLIIVMCMVLLGWFVYNLVMEAGEELGDWLRHEFVAHAYENGVNYVAIEDLPPEAQIRRIWGDLPKEVVDTGIAVSWAENGQRTCDRVSHTGDVGIFQINEYWHGHRGNLYDCVENIKIAKQIYLEQGGFQAWVAYQNKSYLRYNN